VCDSFIIKKPSPGAAPARRVRYGASDEIVHGFRLMGRDSNDEENDERQVTQRSITVRPSIPCIVVVLHGEMK
jgi:hypothetical protein